MNKKIPVLSLLLVLLIPIVTQVVSAPIVPIPSQGHYIVETIGEPETVDPAWAYDTASAGLIFNVYDTLIFFDRENMDVFKPSVASSWLINQPPIAGAPAGTDYTWYFEIKDDIYFQPWKNSTGHWQAPRLLTTDDVEYSFERWMVQDRSGGPEWMIYEPLLERFHASMAWAEAAGNPIDTAVESNSTHVWLNLAMPYPPLMQILCQSWASIVNKEFMIHYGDWPHTWNNWKSYHDPGQAPVDAAGDKMSGSGPFMFDYWNHGIAYSAIAYKTNNPERTDPYAATHEYHGDWPDPHSSITLNRFTEKVVETWGTRLASFRAGSADSVYVPRQFISQVEGWPGIRGMKDIPSLSMDALFFNFDINAASSYIGDGSLAGGDGIPTDFFSDINIRKAFNHLFNFTRFIDEVWLGEAVQATSPVIEGLPYHNPNNPKYSIDLAKAEEYFLAANNTSGGPAEGVWDTGFYVKLAYNTGNQPRQVTAEWFRDGCAAINSAFQVDLIGISWPTYLYEIWFYPTFQSVLPVFIIGWLADYPDAHNWVTPYMHTYGDFSYPQRYSNAMVDELIDIGIRTADAPWSETLTITNMTVVNTASPVCTNWTDGTTDYHIDEWYDGTNYDGVLSECDYVKLNNTKWYHVNSYTSGSTITLGLEYSRKWIYYQLQQLYYDDAPGLAQEQGKGRRWERDWVQGWYSNSIYPGAYYYERWKGLNGDITGDNKVDSLDRGKVNYFWYLPPVYGLNGPTYDPIADIDPVLQKILDQLPKDAVGNPLPSIGKIDVFDLSLLNAHWLEDAGTTPPVSG